MERKRILKRLYGEPPKFDPAMVEALLRDVETKRRLEYEEPIDVRGKSIHQVVMFDEEPYLIGHEDDSVFDSEERMAGKIIGPDGKQLGPNFDTFSLVSTFEIDEDLYFLVKQGYDNALIKSDGTVISEPGLQFYLPVEINNAHVMVGQATLAGPDKENYWAFYDLKGKRISKKYTYAHFHDGFIYADTKSGMVFLDENGNEIGPEYKRITHVIPHNDAYLFSAVEKGDKERKVKLYNEQFKAISDEAFDSLDCLCEVDGTVYFSGKKGNGWAIYDGSMKPITPFQKGHIQLYAMGGELLHNFGGQWQTRSGKTFGTKGARLQRVFGEGGTLSVVLETARGNNVLYLNERAIPIGGEVHEVYERNGRLFAIIRVGEEKYILDEEGIELSGRRKNLKEHEEINGEKYHAIKIGRPKQRFGARSSASDGEGWYMIPPRGDKIGPFQQMDWYKIGNKLFVTGLVINERGASQTVLFQEPEGANIAIYDDVLHVEQSAPGEIVVIGRTHDKVHRDYYQIHGT